MHTFLFVALGAASTFDGGGARGTATTGGFFGEKCFDLFAFVVDPRQ